MDAKAEQDAMPVTPPFQGLVLVILGLFRGFFRGLTEVLGREHECKKRLYDRRPSYVELFGMRKAALIALLFAVVPVSRIATQFVGTT